MSNQTNQDDRSIGAQYRRDGLAPHLCTTLEQLVGYADRANIEYMVPGSPMLADHLQAFDLSRVTVKR